MKLLAATVAVALPVLLSACGSAEKPVAQANQISTPGVLVADAWVRATVGAKDTTMTAAFLSLTNPGSTDLKLTSATSPVAGLVELHEMAMKDGKMVMQQKAGGVTVPAGSHTHLSPGGDHIMLMKLKSPLKPGDELPLTLKFSDNTTHDLTVPVKAFAEEEEHYHPTPTPK
ncbi:copper chaperone PCu(A)C [Kribbella sandramycini]|uniref:Copper chaperone PCu(A)C n=1 Tax=Kribbella sandramycini TaxID=60450 RepID=A0A7Y4L076_9ACTN|nr:copper chaperone PCu(A)C [Kribbella sandramycini]MBB6568983.1 copper(I)-binding protein [Kribbella sandramycini]NOL41172.1 copper chaperone PCu(A)C [Kribbella sandramycini]